MILLLIIAIIVLIVLVTMALSQASDVNRRLNAYLHELGRVEGLDSRLTRLERELKRLLERAGPPPGTPGENAGPGIPGTAPPPAIGTPDASTAFAGGAGGKPPLPAPAAPAAASPEDFRDRDIPPISPWPVEPTRPSRSRAEWEAFVGGKLLNRIGAFALILGVGFFLKYAFDNNWISEAVRVLIGAAAGLACLGVARRTRAKGMTIFAQGLVGGGIAILYLSVYASFNYYHLVSQPVAFALMGLMTGLSLAQGLAYDSLAAGLLGWAGGFLTPFLLSTGVPNEVGLFGYLAALDAALLVLAVRKRGWEVLAPLSMGSTWLVYALWYAEYYDGGKIGVSLAFAFLAWLLFHAGDVAVARRPPAWWAGLRHFAPAVNAGCFYLFLYEILEREHHEWTAPATLALALLYVVTELVVRRDDPSGGADRARNLLTTAALVVIGSAVQYSGFTTVMLWSAEAALLAWYGRRSGFDYLMTASVLLFFIAAVKFAGTDGAFCYTFPGEVGPIVNLRNLTYLLFALSLALGAREYRATPAPAAPAFAAWLGSAAAAALFVLATVTVNDLFSFLQALRPPGPAHDLMFRRLMALGCTWTVYSIPFFWAGLTRGRNTLIVPGLAALLLAGALVTIRGAAFHPIEIYHPAFNPRVAAFFVVLLGMAVHATLIDSHPGVRDWLADVRSYLGLAAGVALFSLLTGETRDYFEQLLAAEPHDGAPGHDPARVLALRNLQQLSISGAWLAYSAVVLAVGIWRGSKGLRFFSIGVFGLSILKIFVYDLSFLETLYRIFSFIGLGLILLAVSYAYQRYKGLLFGAGDDGAGTAGPAPPAR